MDKLPKELSAALSCLPSPPVLSCPPQSASFSTQVTRWPPLPSMALSVADYTLPLKILSALGFSAAFLATPISPAGCLPQLGLKIRLSRTHFPIMCSLWVASLGPSGDSPVQMSCPRLSQNSQALHPASLASTLG